MDAIEIADSSKLKSEYDEIKDSLTTDGLILAPEVTIFEQFIEDIKSMDPLLLGLIITIAVLIIIMIIIFVLYRKAKKRLKYGNIAPSGGKRFE